MFGQHWAIGEELGSGQALHVVQRSPAARPEEAAWRDGVTVRVVATFDTSHAPAMVPRGEPAAVSVLLRYAWIRTQLPREA